MGNGNLVKAVLNEVPEILRQRRRQQVIEATGGDRLVGCRVVVASEASEFGSRLREVEHERSHKDWNL